MKTNLIKMQRLQRSLGRAVAVLGLAALGTTAGLAQNSPVGTIWDCNLSGNRLGLALMSFSADNSLTVYEFMVPKAPNDGSSSSSGRGPGGSRGGTSGSTGSGSTGTNIFGSETANGSWGFDSQGHIIGFWREILRGVCTTNSITITNDQNQFPNLPPGTITNVDTVTCVDITNGVSFTGKVVPGTRLTLTALIGSGRTEFFQLTPSTNGLPNAYDVVGGSANYTYLGAALVSRWNKFAFVIGMDPDDEIVRATVGSFNARHVRFNTIGWEQSAGPLKTRVKFNGTRSSTPD
jgi:hypothetical protein